ncbi:hypothetical protein ACIQZB_00530 [Streptomyces sp. NPDC097727]|uniref:hypothetical protein n=1 Tax=Streptomyces sp. NPDC097727 TaxID=3366092 RepID=UPI0037F6FB6E
MHQHDTPEALRDFLKLCLDPGHGIKRAPVRMAEALPEPLARKVVEFAPHLGGLRDHAEALDKQAKLAAKRAKEAHRAYADALTAWIHDEEPEPVHQSMSLLDAVAASTQAAQEHAKQCDTCDTSMRLAEMCPQGQRAALAALTPGCAHVAWEVTSEFRNSHNLWVKFRQCSDCDELLPPTYDVEPHWPDKAVATCPGFQREHQGVSDAKRRPARCKFCRQPGGLHPK